MRLVTCLAASLMFWITTAYACPIGSLQGIVKKRSIFSPIPRRGSQPLLVLLVDFSDQVGQFTQHAWRERFFGANGFSDYYKEVSYSQLTYSGSVVGISGGQGVVDRSTVAYIRLPQPKSYYSAGQAGTGSNFPRNLSGVFYHAIQALEAVNFDFSPWANSNSKELQNVVVVFAGRSSVETGSQNDIQPTSYSLSANISGGYKTSGNFIFNDFTICPEKDIGGQATIGVCAHEHGHSLGMPDLYDFNFSRSGVGYYDVMAYGTFGADNGAHPFHFGAFSKAFYGWLTPQVLAEGESNLELAPIETNAQAIKLYPASTDREYFIIENRVLSGFNSSMMISGLCDGLYIWHIDQNYFEQKLQINVVNSPDESNGPPYHAVQLVEQDGRGDLTRSPVNYGQCSDRFAVGAVWNDSSTASARLFNGTASGLSIQVVSKSVDGTLSLKITQPKRTSDNSFQGKIALRGGKGTVSGTLSSSSSVSQRTVKLLSKSRVIKTKKTNSRGKFSFSRLRKGSYRVQIETVISRAVTVF